MKFYSFCCRRRILTAFQLAAALSALSPCLAFANNPDAETVESADAAQELEVSYIREFSEASGIRTSDLAAAQRLLSTVAVRFREPRTDVPTTLGFATIASQIGLSHGTGVLIDATHFAMNAHLLPRDLRSQGASCADRIIVRFPRVGQNAEASVACRQVTMVSSSSLIEANQPDLAVFELAGPVNRPFQQLSTEGLPDDLRLTAMLYVIRLNYTQDRQVENRSIEVEFYEVSDCRIAGRSLLAPRSLTPHDSLRVLGGCNIRGELADRRTREFGYYWGGRLLSGAALFDATGRPRALMNREIRMELGRELSSNAMQLVYSDHQRAADSYRNGDLDGLSQYPNLQIQFVTNLSPSAPGAALPAPFSLDQYVRTVAQPAAQRYFSTTFDAWAARNNQTFEWELSPARSYIQSIATGAPFEMMPVPRCIRASAVGQVLHQSLDYRIYRFQVTLDTAFETQVLLGNAAATNAELSLTASGTYTLEMPLSYPILEAPAQPFRSTATLPVCATP